MSDLQVYAPCQSCYGSGDAPGCGHGEDVSHVVDCGTRRRCTTCGGQGGSSRKATTSDLIAALQSEGYAVIERERVRYCPFCGRLVERENPGDEMCLPTNCEAWKFTRRFDHETREWEAVT